MSEFVKEIYERVTPPKWSCKNVDYQEFLYKHDYEWESVVSQMDVLGDITNIKFVSRVTNPYIYGCFQLRLEETKRDFPSARVETLLHDTADENVGSIITHNLNWRRVMRAKYGRGISFTPDATYALKYSNRNNGISRAMIVADVIIGKSVIVEGTLDFPPDGFDTTTSKCGNVIVKYRDDEFCPRYVIYYDLKNCDV